MTALQEASAPRRDHAAHSLATAFEQILCDNDLRLFDLKMIRSGRPISPSIQKKGRHTARECAARMALTGRATG